MFIAKTQLSSPFGNFAENTEVVGVPAPILRQWVEAKIVIDTTETSFSSPEEPFLQEEIGDKFDTMNRAELMLYIHNTKLPIAPTAMWTEERIRESIRDAIS